MINIYSVVDINDKIHRISHSKLEKEAIKEQIVNGLLGKGKQISSLVPIFIRHKEEGFNVVILKQLPDDIDLSSLLSWAKYYRDNETELRSITDKERIYLSPEPLRRTSRWIIYPKETMSVSFNNQELKQSSVSLGLTPKRGIEIMKIFSLFIIHCIQNMIPVRLPILGSFKVKKNLAGDILGEEYRLKNQLKNMNHGTIFADSGRRRRTK